MAEDDDDDGSVNHQKSSHVDMTNDHLHKTTMDKQNKSTIQSCDICHQKNRSMIFILFIWAWKTEKKLQI